MWLKLRIISHQLILNNKNIKKPEQIYKDVLTRAQEKESSTINQQQNPQTGTTNENYDAQGGWYKAMLADQPTVTTTFKKSQFIISTSRGNMKLRIH